MKTIFRNAALALSVLSLGAAVRPVTVTLPKQPVTMAPMPVCPPDDPQGCHILDK